MRRRLALCVGINLYRGGADLAGCVNDANDWGWCLHDSGYSVVRLLDADATKANIIEEIRAMLGSARIGDRVVFTFSGHGTWVPDRDGDEVDRRDEALCPHDYAAGNLIVDDELHALFSQRRFGVRVTIVSDSCHSGTLTRMASPPLIGYGTAIAPRFLPPPGIPSHDVYRLERIAPPIHRTSRTGAVLVSGCADPEYSYDAEFGGRPNGAMTRMLIDSLSPRITVGNAHRRLRALLPSAVFPQAPQLTATAYQKRTALL